MDMESPSISTLGSVLTDIPNDILGKASAGMIQNDFFKKFLLDFIIPIFLI